VTDRSSHSARFSDETWDEFTSWVEEVEGQKHGEIGRHVKNALEEYMNKDRQARLDEQVERVIIDVAELPKGDPRTIRGYKENLRKRGLLYEHPGDPPIWTDDREMWARWANGTASSRDHLEAACEPYPAQVYENGSGIQIEFTEVEA